MYITYEQKNIIPKNIPVVCRRWWDSHVEYYFCRPLHIKMIGLGNLMDLHEYIWMNNRRKDSVNMEQAFCIVPSEGFYDLKQAYSNYYNQIDSVTNIQTFRGNEPAHNFYVYHLSGWKGELPLKE